MVGSKYKHFFSLLFIVAMVWSAGLAQKIADKAIPVGHAHNDYLHRKPLWDALKHGYTSMEIDVFSFKNALKVAHVGVFLNIRKNIDQLYLAPLNELLSANDGVIYSDYADPIVLMIDFKTSSTETLPLLKEAIAPYKEWFTYYDHATIHEKPLKLVISGGGFRWDQVQNDSLIYFFLDGGVGHCNENMPPELVSRGSTHYGSSFSRNLSSEEKEKLTELVNIAHRCNRTIRFWALPHNKDTWKVFLDTQVDWINIDKLKKFKKFYWEYVSQQASEENPTP